MLVSGCTVLAVTIVFLPLSASSSAMAYDVTGSLEQCGSAVFDPSKQCCCDGNINNIPQHQCQCCYDQGREKTPGVGVGCCRGVFFNQSTELCCGGEVVDGPRRYICCGTTVINTRIYDCCADQTPYHKQTMECDFNTAKMSLMVKQSFNVTLVCDKSLPVFNVSMTTPDVINKTHTHIRGKVNGGQVTIKDKKITVPLSAVAVVGRHKDCLTSRPIVELQFRLKKDQDCSSSQIELQEYFHGQVLDVFVKKRLVCGKTRKRAVLRLKEGHNAVVYMAGPLSDLMVWSMNKQ